MPSALVIDDYPPHSHLYASRLEELGYKVSEADTDERAEELLRVRYDVIVLDVQLPNTEEGLDLLRKLRTGAIEGSANNNTPVVVLTIRSDDMVVQASRELNVTQFCVKPVDFEEFKKAIEQAVEKPS